jgi:hypothetical protein
MIVPAAVETQFSPHHPLFPGIIPIIQSPEIPQTIQFDARPGLFHRSEAMTVSHVISLVGFGFFEDISTDCENRGFLHKNPNDPP